MNIENPQAEESTLAEVLGLGKAKRRWWPIVTVVATVSATAGGYALTQRKAAPVDRYEQIELVRADLEVTVSATGSVESISTVEVGCEISGRVTRVLVDFNDTVEVGQLLAEIDREQYQATLDEATARLAGAEAAVLQAQVSLSDARAKYERAKRLADAGLSSAAELETAKATRDRTSAELQGAIADGAVARAAMQSATSKLQKTKIVSPVRGIVLSRLVERGQTVTAGFTTPVLFKLAEDLTKMQLSVYVDEADMGRVKQGLEASFTVDAFPGRRFASRVLSLRFEPRIDQNVVSYEAVLAAENEELLLRPGMTATATIVSEKRSDVLLVPNAALRFEPVTAGGPGSKPLAAAKGPHVWVTGSADPVSVDVKPGASNGELTELLESGDLVVGDRVIVDLRSAE